MHAAAVGVRGHGVLLAGAGGAGKSTTALAAYARGLELCGDDYCALGPGPTVHALYGVGKLEPDAARLVPELDGPIVALEPTPSLALSAVVLPRVVPGGRTTLTPVSPAAALRALAPSSTFQLPGAPRGPFAALAALVRELPAYRLELWEDLDGAVGALEQLC